ncbi:MAG: gamma-glutamyltransferase [Lachnospiraceae bacterium]|nr:gamma-glutamyltransferase [Lachnospiraceae bacterium]
MKRRIFSILFVLCLILCACGSQNPAGTEPETAFAAPSSSVPQTQASADPSETTAYGNEYVHVGGRDAVGENGVVATGREDATQIGIDILKAGGNAIDAAVAIGFALGVSEQQSSGIGGGGFMTVRFAKTGEVVFIDFRDVSGAAARLDLYEVLENGLVKDQANKIGALSVAVPGEVKGMLYALETYGTMDRRTVMQPAIDLAENGFEVSKITSRDIKDAYASISRFEATAAIYLDPDEMPWEMGTVITNQDLANSLRLIAEQGEEVFYKGEIAEKIVEAVQAEGGYLTLEDFANYEINVLEPVHGTYRGCDIYSSNLPSSGGSIIIEMLNILENFDVGAMDPESAEYFHLLSEVMKLGFADRSQYMGDPRYVDVPLAGIISKEYAKQQAARINMTKSGEYAAGDPWAFESESTTSYSILDKEGNMVTVTKTVDATFASALVAAGTGILLNDTLVDFSLDPESPNVLAANKRPLSSMSPTLVLKDGQPLLALGAPGMTRIITGVMQVITKVIDHGMDIQDAIDAVRMHDDFGTLILEKRVPDSVIEELKAMGHKLNTGEEWFTFPCVQACERKADGTLKGAADPRRDGKALGY